MLPFLPREPLPPPRLASAKEPRRASPNFCCHCRTYTRATRLSRCWTVICVSRRASEFVQSREELPVVHSRVIRARTVAGERRRNTLLAAGGLVLLLLGCGTTTPRSSHPGPSPPQSRSGSTPPSTPATPTAPAVTGTTSPQRAACSSSALTVIVRASRASYSPGEHVVLTVLARNDSSAPCSVRTGNCIPQVVISDGSGVTVWNRATTQVVCMFGTALVLARARTATQVVTWDGRRCAGRSPTDCPGTRALPGKYGVSARWETVREASTSLRIVS